LQDVRRGTVGVERAGEHIAEALKHVGRVRELSGELGQRDGRLPLKERCAEALALVDEAGANPALKRKRAELEAEMSAVDGLIRKRFLGGGESVERRERKDDFDDVGDDVAWQPVVNLRRG